MFVGSVPRAIDRSDAQGWFLLGKLAQDRGDFVEAANAFHAATEERPGLALAHEGLGLALLGLGREEEGVQSLRRAVELDVRLAPSGAERLLQLLLAREDFDEAIALARKIGAALPHSAQGPFDESRVHFHRYERLRASGARAEDQAAALAAAREALQRTSERTLDTELRFAVPFSMGRVALEAQRPAEAVAPFERALAAQPTPDAEGWYFEAVRGLVFALRASGRASEAAERLDAFLPKTSDDPRATALRAELLGR
ncbi:MAG: tetratricopeptide repeat protein [Planctomycetes bacterium]|nr:tetratricopeptide repeat protein [Planctomycetota bacterium]